MTAVTGPSTAFTLTATPVLSSAVRTFTGTTRTHTPRRRQRIHTTVTTRNVSAVVNLSIEGTTSATISAITTRKTFKSAVSPTATTGLRAGTPLATGGAAHAVSSASTFQGTATIVPSATPHASPSGRRKGARSDETHEASLQQASHVRQCFSLSVR